MISVKKLLKKVLTTTMLTYFSICFQTISSLVKDIESVLTVCIYLVFF